MRPDCPLPAGSLLWIYCRHSPGDEQDIGSQVRGVEAYCEQHSLVIAHIFKDIAKRGWSIAGRDEFLAMIHAAHQEPRPVEGVAFWSFSRVARDIDLAQFYIADLRLRGYKVFSVTEFIPEGPEGRIIEAAIHFANAKAIEDNRREIKRGLHDLARKGYAPGGAPPAGYKAEKLHIGYKTSGAPKYARRWVPDPETFPLAQRAWEMRANGATYQEIDAACPVYKQPRCWGSFFANKTYLGIRKCGDIEVENAHPAACTQEQWDIVQAMRERKRGGAYPRRVSSPFLLSGLLECAYCSGPMSGSTSGGHQQRWRYYVCSRKPNRGWDTCKSRSIGANKLDHAVISVVLNQILTPERFTELVEEVNRRLLNDQNGLDLKIQSKQHELVGVGDRISNLLYAVAGGSLSATDLLVEEERRQAQLQSELVLLQQRAVLERVVMDDSVVAAELEKMRHALTDFSKDSVRPLRRFLQSFVDRIVVNEAGGELYYHLPVILPRSQSEVLKALYPKASVTFSLQTPAIATKGHSERVPQ